MNSMPMWHTRRGAGLTTPYAAGEEPLRAELLNAEQMEERGRELAAEHKARASRFTANPLLQRLSQNAEVIRECCGVLAQAIKENHKVTPAGEWLLDNLYLIDEQIRTARRHLPRRYSWQLPVLAKGSSAGLPRVYDIALKAISHGDGRFDEDSLRRFVTAYQEISPLTLGELWAIPIVLRLALIENLRRVAYSVRADRADRNVAIRWADAMIDVARRDPTGLILVAADMAREQPPMSSSFVSELSRRLQPLGDALSLPMTWIDQRLAESGLTSDQLVQSAQREQAADQVSVSNCIGSLRLLDALDWKTFVESVSVVERLLRDDPAHFYANVNFATRDMYRHVIEKLARESKRAEPEVAGLVHALAAESTDASAIARHVGYYLVDDGYPNLRERCSLPRQAPMFDASRAGHVHFATYLCAIVLLGALLLVPVVPHLVELPRWAAIAAAFFSALTFSQLAMSLVNRAAALMISPRRLPQMDFRAGIPAQAKTIVAVPTLLTSVDRAQRLVDDLEIRYLANRDAHLAFALLTDFGDAPAESMPDDAAILEAAAEGIRRLNARYADSNFLLLHRPRRWNARDRVWMGFERKRGKLSDLNALLRDPSGDAFSQIVGDAASLGGTRYVITLDSDSQLPRDAARHLIEAMAHPLNHPRFDPTRNLVTRGHAILQPRVGNVLLAGGTTLYANLFGGDAGVDPYTRAVSDTYQDLFDEGSFIGKGIYDVDAFERALADRFPDNRILSHDLLEGCYARSGLASDIELYEEHPKTYLADARRRRRWMRGDWQIARWLFPSVPAGHGTRERNPLSALSRWKIFDNLRRSLVPIAFVALLAIGWFVSPSPGFWAAIIIEVLLVPLVLDVALSIATPGEEGTSRQFARNIGSELGRGIARAAITLACLPFEAWLSIDAIARTFWRVHVSKRKLLQWTVSSATQAESRSLGHTIVVMAASPLLAIALAVLIARAAPTWSALPWLVAWFVSPGIVWLLGTAPNRRERALSADDVMFLRRVARRTWRFFERFVGEEDHWLPPDNYQEHPVAKTAHRTSPTNIGLHLLSTLAAHDFGYLSLRELIERLTRSLDTLDRLPRHRGHFYNWYDTKTLQPLAPLYVSTVDSGNLIAHLLTLRQGLLERLSGPIVPGTLFDGIDDTLGLGRELDPSREDALWKPLGRALARAREDAARSPGTTLAGLRSLHAVMDQFPDDASTVDGDVVASLHRQIAAFIADIEHFASETDAPDAAAPQLLELCRHADAACAGRAAETRRALEALAVRCRDFARVDFDFLFDAGRSLFTIGYNVSEHRRDAGFYDLLASEARLGVFVAIAQGRIAQDAWFSLGRLLTAASGGQVLLSWSGSMFEYLMPELVMPAFPGALLTETCRAAVLHQIAYARGKGVPWGISESGYNVTDAAQNYQYRAFGVPGLGLQRGLAQELVIAPYASVLALTTLPHEAARNLQSMAAKGWLTPIGFYEAIDYTPARVPHGQDHAIVRSFMAHHHGMSLVAIAHAVLDQPMQRRFASDAELQATMLLLQERMPRSSINWSNDPAIVDVRSPQDAPQTAMRVFARADTARPAVQLLTNGRYQLMVTNSGGGYSRWRDVAITRWREDATRDPWGVFCYLRDADTGKIWSTTPAPASTAVDYSEAIFSESQIEFRRRLDDIEAYTQIVVSPEDDIELRRVRLTNRARTERTIEITSYAEVVLASAIGDALHPAFGNLFVQTEILSDRDAILATRRRRSSEEAQRWMFQLLALHDATSTQTSFESDRLRFIGRGNDAARPAAVHATSPMSGADGSVLDPVLAVRHRLVLKPDQSAVVDLVLGVAENREQCVALVEKYRDRHLADRAIEIAWTHNRIALGQINISEVDAQTYSRLAGAILYADPARRTNASTIASNHLAQPGLWAHAISGDLPIVLLKMSGAENLNLVRQLVDAHVYCRMKGLDFDLVIWNEERGGYRQALHDEIMAIIGTSADAAELEQKGGVFVRSIEQINHEDRVLMQSVARIVLSDQEGTLAEQLDAEKAIGSEIVVPELVAVRPIEAPPRPAQAYPLPPRTLVNGVGGFAAHGAEYVMSIDAKEKTPLPWVNVIANPNFGCVVSESGSGYTWCENAHEYRLTPWSNDSVCDPAGEVIYVRDEETGEFWSTTPAPAPGRARYVTRHGFGYSIFETTQNGITSHLRLHVDADAPVKFFMLRLNNESGRARRLSVTGYIEWVLGDLREKTAMHVVTELDGNGALLARNAYSIEFPDLVAFFDVDNPQRTLSGDRTEFIGRNGSLRRPAAMSRQTLSGRLGAAMDPCGAIQIPVELADGESRDFIFRVGVGRDRQDASRLVMRFRRNGSARASFEAIQQRWKRLLGAISVRSPDPALDMLANGWLLYQVISCRLWARSGFYQSGGAFGFRDQLQDAMALVHADASLLRAQIVLSASRQFVEGDVQHWWHPPAGRGVRTQCSDDFLWLPLATARYLEATGEDAVLDERIGFLEGRPLNQGEESYYDMPLRSAQSGDLYEHCRRAIEHGFRTGAHGLPLMGSGDWNDGMNNVGRQGRGESVWLGFFFSAVLAEFEPIARRRGDEAFAARCRERADALRDALEKSAWDGKWYLRAFFDDGTPLGSAKNRECRIDSIAQSWSKLSGAGSPARVTSALDEVDHHLVDEHGKLIRLLAPPFDTADPDPGYIRGYVPGVRENGGQYTHAAVWAVMAFFADGRTKRAWELFDLINPVRHAATGTEVDTYMVEPYVLAADVLAVEPHTGRGGWTWYTGSAGWMYRLISESMLGLKRRGATLLIEPRLPDAWDSLEVD
ncbi:MAG TPA: glucoamylase family protein, partial [Rhodanobacteraceae bacterium]|nr:glucoamylase family protein [Rhodanobacteraceae bacterium]